MTAQQVASPRTLTNRLAPRNGHRNRRFEPLLRRLQLLDKARAPLQTIGVTSCTWQEGVSTVAANLAALAAPSSPRPVLLVDANIARPSVQQTFRVEAAPGLVDVICRGLSPRDCIQQSIVENMWILASGSDGSTPPLTTYDTTRMKELVEYVKRDFDWVVFDLSPVAECRNALLLSGLLDGTLLVVESERTRPETAQAVQQQLVQADAKVLGVVLNKLRGYIPRWLDQRI